MGYFSARDANTERAITDEARNRSIYEREKLKNMQAMPTREINHVRIMKPKNQSLNFSDFFVGRGDIANAAKIGNVIAKAIIDTCIESVMLFLFIAKNWVNATKLLAARDAETICTGWSKFIFNSNYSRKA